jgi:hypothetical protein
MAKKLKNEAQLLKEAIRIGIIYAEKRGVAKFEASDGQDAKIEYIYRLLVHDISNYLTTTHLSKPGVAIAHCNGFSFLT